MNEMIYFFLPLILSLIAIYFFNKFSRKKNFVLGIDINKKTQNKTPEATGIILLIILWIVVLWINFTQTFNLQIFYWLGLVSVFSLIGFLDDTTTKWTKKGLSWKQRAVPIAFFSFLFGYLISGEILSGILIGAFISGFSSFHNSFAGLNGWEVGSSYIIAVFTCFLLISTGFFVYSLILLGIILALLLFNIYPAKVFPGDSGTLLIGSSITGLIALTMKTELIFFFALFYLPHFIDLFFLKILTNPEDPTQVKIKPYKLLENGKLDIPEYKGKTKLDFAKLILKIFGSMKEWKIVLIIWIIVALNCLFWFIVSGKITL